MKFRLALAALAAVTLSQVASAHGPLRRFVARVEAAFPRLTNHLPGHRLGFHNPVGHCPTGFPTAMPGPGHVTHPGTCPACPGGVCPAPEVAPKFIAVPGGKVFGADPPVVVGAGKLRIGKRIAEFRAGVKAELEKRGFDAADIHIVGQLGDGKIFEWIITHGPDVVKFVEMLMALFGVL